MNLTQKDIIVNIIIALIVAGALLAVNEMVFKKLIDRQKKLHYTFFRLLFRIIIVIVCIVAAMSSVNGFSSVWKSVLGSTVVIGAVVGFAAQNILKNILAGIMISIDRPFEVGDRVIISGVAMPCVVENMTMRNTILRTMDNLHYIVPNSEMDQKIIMNCSYRGDLWGTIIQVPISYEADVSKTIHVIREAVKSCPYTRPNNPRNKDLGGYGDVYLMSYDNSCYLFETVIWTEKGNDNYYVCSEVRKAIVKALDENGIEIPYQCINIFEREREGIDLEKRQASYGKYRRDTRIKTDKVLLDSGDYDIDKALDITDQFIQYLKIDESNSKTLKILTEDLVVFSEGLTDWSNAEFWVEGTTEKAYIRLDIRTRIDREDRQKLNDLSSNGISESGGFAGMIRRMISRGNTAAKNESISYSAYKLSSGDSDDLEKTMLTSLSDDIKVTVKGDKLKITVVKTMTE